VLGYELIPYSPDELPRTPYFVRLLEQGQKEGLEPDAPTPGGASRAHEEISAQLSLSTLTSQSP
jgi:hypothetical protein